MKITYLLIFVVSFFVPLSCQQQSPEERLMSEAIEIHDVVMPEMSTVFQLRKELSLKKDSLVREDISSPMVKVVEKRIEELANANEIMMQWMRGFNQDFEGDVNLSRLDYLQAKRDEIEIVKNEFDLAIENAKVTLSNLR